MIGTKVSRYKITEKIGEGGMGSVWRAEDPNLGRDVALKFLPDSLASSPEARKRFLREGKAAATLHHPGIAAVHDADEADGRVYIAFQLVRGETVAERIARGPLDVNDACRLAFDAAEALDHAHARGVLHRDVTSRNIMIDKEGQVIVVDFGLALPQGATRVTHTGTAVGTAPYLSPEVITGGEGDARADVYGLGVVLYEALTGRLPFDAERSESLFYLIVHTDAEAPGTKRDDIPPELDRIVMRALSKDPDERYQSAREFAKDLYSYLETASVEPPSARWLTAPPPAPRPRPIPQRLKRIATKPVTWVVVLVIAAAVVYGITKLTPEPEPAPEQAFASVAVLPFQNLGDAPEESAWLAEGIAEALAGRLTSLPSIKVTPWFTSRNFRDISRPPGEIATELNTEALVVGTVRQIGERLLCRVTVIDARKGAQWWAQEYKESLDDLFEVQERIALGVARNIGGHLSGADERQLARPAAHNVAAYEHYLRGAALIHEETRESVVAAIPLFERALELDPELADAYVGLGAVGSNLYTDSWGGTEALREAERAFQRALEIDPASTGARRGLIRVYFEFGRSEDVLKQGREALRANPDGIENMLAMGEAYANAGLPTKAIPLLRRVTELDPANEGAYWFLTYTYYCAGRYADVIETTDLYWRKFGGGYLFLLWPGLAYQQLGDADAAELYFNRAAERGTPTRLMGAGAFFLARGDVDKAHAFLSEGIAECEQLLRANLEHLRDRRNLAAMWGLMGDRARLERELEKSSPIMADYVPAALARLGDIQGAAAQLEDAARSGCNQWGFLNIQAALYPDGFFEHPDVQPALRALRELHDDLAARY